jgi:hypothetical protein
MAFPFRDPRVDARDVEPLRLCFSDYVGVGSRQFAARARHDGCVFVEAPCHEEHVRGPNRREGFQRLKYAGLGVVGAGD